MKSVQVIFAKLLSTPFVNAPFPFFWGYGGFSMQTAIIKGQFQHPSEPYTQIPNSILDNIFHFDFDPTDVIVLLVIARLTYGFHRKEVDISRSFLADKASLWPEQVTRAINNLLVGNVITRKAGRIGTGRALRRLQGSHHWH